MKNKKYSGINKIFRSDAIATLQGKMHDGTFREFLDDWKWIFSYSKRYKGIVIFYTVLGILTSTLSLAASYLGSRLINIITEKQTDKLPFLIVFALSSTVFSLVFSSVMSRVSTRISIYVNNDIQGEIFDRIIDVKWSELNKYKNGDLLNRFNGDVGTISGNAISWIPNLIINLYTFTATFVVLYRLDHIMAWIALLAAPILMLFSHYVMKNQKKYRKKVLELNSDMMSFEMETFYNIDNVKAFGIWNQLSKELRAWQKKYKDFNLAYNAFQIKTGILLSLLSTAVSTGAFGYCLYRLWTGQILFGDMSFFLNQREALSTKFNALVATFPSMVNSSISAHRVRELVDLPKEEHDPKSLELAQQLSAQGLTVKLNDVSFAYTDGKDVYKNAQFLASPGEVVAVLGESGGGKTTLFRLILGLVEPTQGSVSLCGKGGEVIPMGADMRTLISYVPQGNSMILGSIADNLRIVKENATDEELVAVLKTACAWDFVESVGGINAPLKERGKGISEGQAQRIGIARAILRDAPILMLDEATSALDEDTEARVIDNIMDCCKNKTVIVSTHRPSVLRKCKRVYRIMNQQTEVVEEVIE